MRPGPGCSTRPGMKPNGAFEHRNPQGEAPAPGPRSLHAKIKQQARSFISFLKVGVGRLFWKVFNFAHFSLLRWRGVLRAGRAFQPAHAQPTGTGAALSLPVRWRFLLLSRLAARAGFVTQRQTFVRRCQTL